MKNLRQSQIKLFDKTKNENAMAAVTLKSIWDHQIIGMAINSTEKYQQGAKFEEDSFTNIVNMLDNLFNSNDGIEEKPTHKIKINTDITSFNSTLGSFNIIFEYYVEKDGVEISNNLIGIEITEAGEKSTEVEIKAEEGATITISSVYCTPNYDLKSNADITTTVLGENDVLEFNFAYEYNGGMVQVS